MAPRIISLTRADRAILIAIAALLAVVAAELAAWSPPWTDAARAQIPNAGDQRMQQVDQARRGNELLERIARHLETGPVPVRIEKAASHSAAGGAAGGVAPAPAGESP